MHLGLGLAWYGATACAGMPPDPPEPSRLLLESGGFLLLESGDKLLMG